MRRSGAAGGLRAAGGLVLAATVAGCGLWARGGTDLAAKATPPAVGAGAPAASPTPDGPWQKDEKGRDYRVLKLAKTLPHLRVDDRHVRTAWGFTVEIAGESETDFLVKRYRTAPAATGPRVRSGFAEKEKARAAAAFAASPEASERLALERFDEGLPKQGQWRDGFALADMNRDGHLDVVHGPVRKQPSGPVVFLGDGRGKWSRWTSAKFPSAAYDYGDVAVGDFDADGALDLALAMHLRGVLALRGDGRGRFALASRGMDPLGDREKPAFSSRAIEAVDWDGDDKTDLLVLGEGPRLPSARAPVPVWSQGPMLYRSLGDRWEKQVAAERSRVFGSALAVGRLDGEKLGFVTATGQRGERRNLFVAGSPWTVRELDAVRRGALVQSVAVADFDGDGRDDVALGYLSYDAGTWRSGVDLALQRDGGTWQRRDVLVLEGRAGVTALAAGPLGGGKEPGLVALTGDGRVLLLPNAGGGELSRETAEPTAAAAGCRGYHAELADLDGDGARDLVASFAGEPEGMIGLGTPGCPGGGGIRAWRILPR